MLKKISRLRRLAKKFEPTDKTKELIKYQLTSGEEFTMVRNNSETTVYIIDRDNNIIESGSRSVDYAIFDAEEDFLNKYDGQVYTRYVVDQNNRALVYEDNWIEYVEKHKDTVNENQVKDVEQYESRDMLSRKEIDKLLNNTRDNNEPLKEEEIEEMLSVIEDEGQKEEVREEIELIEESKKEVVEMTTSSFGFTITFPVENSKTLSESFISKYSEYFVGEGNIRVAKRKRKNFREKYASLNIKTNSRLMRRTIEAASWSEVQSNPLFQEGNVVNLVTYYPLDNQTNTAFIVKNLDTNVYYAIDSNGTSTEFSNFSQAENHILGNNPESIGDRNVTQEGFDDGNVSNSDVWNAYNFQLQQQNYQQNLEDPQYREDNSISEDYQYNEQSFVEYMQQNPPQTLDDVQKLVEEGEKNELVVAGTNISIDYTFTATDEVKSTMVSELETLKNNGTIVSYVEI